MSNDFQKEPWTYALGNGFAFGRSAYGSRLVNLNTTQSLYIEDLGFIGLYIYAGIIAVLAYVIIFYKSFFAKIPEGFVYVKLFIAFLFLNGLTSFTSFSDSFVPAIVFCLYIMDVYSGNIILLNVTTHNVNAIDIKQFNHKKAD